MLQVPRIQAQINLLQTQEQNVANAEVKNMLPSNAKPPNSIVPIAKVPTKYGTWDVRKEMKKRDASTSSNERQPVSLQYDRRSKINHHRRPELSESNAIQCQQA